MRHLYMKFNKFQVTKNYLDARFLCSVLHSAVPYSKYKTDDARCNFSF